MALNIKGVSDMAQCEDCLHYEICEIMSEQYGISKVYPSQCGFYTNTADVVPKSEVDKIISTFEVWLYKHYNGDITELEFYKLFAELKKKYTGGD
jgi:hypothetical protein